MLEETKRSRVRKVNDSWLYDAKYLRLIFMFESYKNWIGTLKIQNLETSVLHTDRFNLLVAQSREKFAKSAAEKINLSAPEIESHLDQFVADLTEQCQKKENGSAVVVTDKERQWGESFLNNKEMFQELLQDFATLGCVGEQTSLLTSYLVANSRILDGTLAAVITSQSGAGKSAVLNAVLKLIPEEYKKNFSRMSPTSFYYQEEGGLKNKAVFLAEEASAEQTDLAIRCLLSDGFINNVVTLRDPKTGSLVAKETRIDGPSSFLTTTTIDHFDDETLNRFLRLSIDENRLQTRKVMDRQLSNRKLQGLEEKHYSDYIEKKHHAAQRLLKKIDVVHPYADSITFRDDLLRFRREHEKYLRLIDVIALLRQRQKEVKQYQSQRLGKMIPYIEATLDDIELANTIAEKVMRLTLDELRPQARNLLVIIHEHASRETKLRGIKLQDYRFTRRDVIAWSGFPDTHVRRYLKELHDYEYVKSWNGSQGCRYEYELVFYADPAKETEFNLGLVDVNKIREKEAVSHGNGNRLMGHINKLLGRFEESSPLKTGTSPEN